jgi:chromosome partitioning protein
MAKIVGVLNQKGGCSKTTTAVHVSTAIAKLFDMRVALADADPQASALTWLSRAEKPLVTTHQVGSEDGKWLKQELANIDTDLIILDLPPSLEAVSLRAALLSDLILLPAGPSPVDISATKAAVSICKEAIDLVPTKKYLLVPSRVQMNTALGRELRDVLATWGPVARATICLRVGYSAAAAFGMGILEYAPDTPGAAETQMLAEEVLEILGIKPLRKARPELV